MGRLFVLLLAVTTVGCAANPPPRVVIVERVIVEAPPREPRRTRATPHARARIARFHQGHAGRWKTKPAKPLPHRHAAKHCHCHEIR